jgi:hypothetical protein
MTTTFATVGPFLLLFGLLYAGFGVASPFLRSLMEARGIPAELDRVAIGRHLDPQPFNQRAVLAPCTGGLKAAYNCPRPTQLPHLWRERCIEWLRRWSRAGAGVAGLATRLRALPRGHCRRRQPDERNLGSGGEILWAIAE